MSRPSASLLATIASAISLAAPGCGDNDQARDASLASATACTATFAGTFDETSQGTSDCPTVAVDATSGDVTLAFQIPSAVLAAPLALGVDLGTAPSPGEYSPEIVQNWSAIATSAVDSACVYSAGTAAVPNGTFTLVLAAIDPVHGTASGSLTVDAYLHAFVMTDCGSVPTERVAIGF